MGELEPSSVHADDPFLQVIRHHLVIENYRDQLAKTCTTQSSRIA